MVLAPQRIPHSPSSTLSIGRERTVFCGTCPCSRSRAKKQHRLRDSPNAHRLARLVGIVLSFVIAHSFLARGIDPLWTLPWSLSPGRSALSRCFSSDDCPPSWRKKLAAEPSGRRGRADLS